MPKSWSVNQKLESFHASWIFKVNLYHFIRALLEGFVVFILWERCFIATVYPFSFKENSRLKLRCFKVFAIGLVSPWPQPSPARGIRVGLIRVRPSGRSRLPGPPSDWTGPRNYDPFRNISDPCHRIPRKIVLGLCVHRFCALANPPAQPTLILRRIV